MALVSTYMVAMTDGGSSGTRRQQGSDIQAQLDAKAQEKSNYESSIETFESQHSTLTAQEEQIQTQLTSAKETVSLAETAVMVAEQNVTNAQSAVASAESVVNAAKTEVMNANSAVASARNALQSAYSVPVRVIKNEDGTVTYDSSARDAAIAAAQAKLAAAEKKLQHAQMKLSNAEAQLEKANNELKTAESELKTAESELKTAEKAVTDLETKASDLAAQIKTLDTQISDLEAKISAVEQEYNALLQKAKEEEQKQQEETPVNGEEGTQTVDEYMLAAIEAELQKQQSEIQAEADSKTGLGKAWDGLKGWFGGGTSGALDDVSEMYDVYNSLKNGGDTTAIAELYTKVFAEEPDIQSMQESIKAQESLKEGSFTLENGESVNLEDVAKQLSNQVDKLSNDFNDSVESQGIFSKAIGWINNNVVGLGTTEKMAQAQMEECQNLVDKLASADTEQEFASIYKSLTGEDLTTESLNELFEGTSKVSSTKASETAMDYEQTQENALNAVSTTVAGIATAAMGPLVGMAVGAAVNVGIKALDAGTQKNDKSFIEDVVDYAKEDMLKDALVGGVTGLSGGLANNAGKAVAGSVLKNQVGNVIKNEAGEFLVETATSRIAGEFVEGAFDGAVGNSLEYIVDCALDEEKEFSWSELGQTAAVGIGFGALAGVGLGEASNKLLGSNTLSVKAGDDIKIEGGTLTNARTGKSVSFDDQKVILLNNESIDIDNINGSISLDSKNPTFNIFAENTNNAKFELESEQMKDIFGSQGTDSAIEFIQQSNIFTDTQKASLSNSVQGMQDYQYNSDIINGFLRKQADLDKLTDIDESFQNIVDFTRQGYDDLSKPLTEETVVYRKEIQTSNYNPNREVGEIFTADAFTSTTLDKNDIGVNSYINGRVRNESKFDGLEHGVTNIEIVLPAGTNVVHSSAMNEVLLKNGSKFEVVGYNPDTNTYRWSLIPDDVKTASSIDMLSTPYSANNITASPKNGYVYSENLLPESGVQGKKSIFSLFSRKDNVVIHTKTKDIQNAAVGDMVQLPNAKNVGIKLADGTIEELNISAQTYKRLFPEGNDVNVKQRDIGDCYLVSSLYTMLSNPETSPSVLRCFTENADGSISCKLPNGNIEFTLNLGQKTTDYVEATKIVEGSEGVRMLEYTYGLELVGKESRQLQERLSIATNYLDELVKEKPSYAFLPLLDVDSSSLDLQTAQRIIDEIDYGDFKIGDFFPQVRESNFYSKYIIETEQGVSFNTAYIKEKYQSICGEYNKKIANQEKMIAEINSNIAKIASTPGYEKELRDAGGLMYKVFSEFGLASDSTYSTKFEDGLELLKDLNNNKNYIFGAGSKGISDKKYLNEELNIAGNHAYTIKPQNGITGETLFEITNPWDTSKHVTLNEEQMKEYFRVIYYAKIS